MPFSARNARYLRISGHTVLPLYIYLDDKHIEWMSDYILQQVLADLKPLIGPKIRKESNLYDVSRGSSGTKTGTVDTKRGESYQFAYFLRKNESHAILIKNPKFVPTPVAPTSTAPVDIFQGKRDAGSRPRRQQNSSGNGNDARVEDFEQGQNSLEMIESQKRRRSGRKKLLAAGGYDGKVSQAEGGAEMVGSEINADDNYAETLWQIDEQFPSAVTASEHQLLQTFDVEAEEEEKPKLALQVSYQGFTIHDRCLCIVIEPWTPLKHSSAPSVTPSNAPLPTPGEMRSASVDESAIPFRGRTPLFLPDPDPRRSVTPIPLPSRILPPVSLFDASNKGEQNDGGMVAFSQALKSVGDECAGNADEDQDEGDIFLGDADEHRGYF